jgi:hypothetical protein
MKVLGTIKTFFPINAFTTIIFIGSDGKYYVQKVLNDKIKSFEEISIDESVILKANNFKHVKVNYKAVYCYLTEHDKPIIGTLNSIRKKMFALLEGNELNPIAKVIISSMYKFHGKTSKLVSESNKYFLESGINCRLNKYDYINTIPWEQKDIKELIKKLFLCKIIVDKYKSFDWLDLIEFEDKKINIKKFSLSIDTYISISENRINIITNDIINSILSGIERNTIKRTRIEENESIYKLFLNSETSNSKFDEILFPKSKSRDYMISDYASENILARQDKDTFISRSMYSESDLQRVIEISKKIKSTLIKDRHGE